VEQEPLPLQVLRLRLDRLRVHRVLGPHHDGARHRLQTIPGQVRQPMHTQELNQLQALQSGKISLK